MTPRRFFHLSTLVFILFYAFAFSLPQAHADTIQQIPNLTAFVTSVKNDWPGVVSGVYVYDQFALPVVQQPQTNPAYVSGDAEVATEFAMARSYGNIGILAHNYLAGSNFFSLAQGDRIQVVFGNGAIETFMVTEILRYQAEAPTSPYTNFVDLTTGEKVNVETVFKRVYMGERHITFQTCIADGNEPSWGRLFVIAKPLPPARHSESTSHDR